MEECIRTESQLHTAGVRIAAAVFIKYFESGGAVRGTRDRKRVHRKERIAEQKTPSASYSTLVGILTCPFFLSSCGMPYLIPTASLPLPSFSTLSALIS